MKWGLLCVFVFVLSVSFVSVNAYQEGIHLIRPDSSYITNTYAYPEYLTIEDLTFLSCLEDDDIQIRNSILCLDDNSFEDLESVRWTDENCYISSYNLEDFECKQLLIQAEYTKDEENLRFTKKIRVNKFSQVLNTILDTQYSDGGWRDPLSTAYAIWALSYYKTLYKDKLEMAVDWLKDNRNEEQKCWPEKPCSTQMTANILSLLSLGEYSADLLEDPDARRIVNDARNWFEEIQNDYTQGDEWVINISSVVNDTVLTLVGYDGEVLDENFTLLDDGVRSYTINAKQDSELVILGDESFLADIYDANGKLFTSYQGDNLTYIIPGACWSGHFRGEPCDPRTTSFVMMSPIDSDKLAHAKDWARTNVSYAPILGRYFGSSMSIIDTALYIYNLYEDDNGDDYFSDMLDYLLYSQNNEGSWDEGETEDKAIPTAYAVLSLFTSGYNRTSETIYDAEEWLGENEDNISENNTAALSSAFYVLKHNARPLLTSQPKIIVMETPSLDVEIFNPTTFDLNDLSYSFSENIREYVTIEEKEDIASFTYRKFTLTRKGTRSEDIYGFLTIKNMDEPVAEIPVVLTDTPMINVSYPELLTVFGKSGEMTFSVTKSSHEFVCNMVWDSPDIVTLGSFKVKSNSATMLFEFDSARTLEDVYTGTLFCTARGKTSSHPISVYIKRFSDTPLSFWPEDIVVNSTERNAILTLKNNLDRDLHVDIDLDRYDSYFTFNKNVDLNPNEEYNLTFYNAIPRDLNLTSSVLVKLTMFNRSEYVSLLIDVMAMPPQQKSYLGLVVRLVIVLLIISILGYVFYRFRDVIFAELNKLTFWRIKTEKKKEVSKIQQIKKEEHLQAIINLYNIMKLQNKEDKEIAGKLLEGFSRDDIRAALLSVGAALPSIEEEEPEKVQ